MSDDRNPVPRLMALCDGAKSLEVVPKAPRSRPAKSDPIMDMLDGLVDEVCQITSEVSNEYRALKAGDRRGVGKRMTALAKKLSDAQAKAQIISWECSKPEPRRLGAGAQPLRLKQGGRAAAGGKLRLVG